MPVPLEKEGEKMEQIKGLNRYQKGILLLLIVMAITFCVIYAVISHRVGYLYHDVILVPSEENGNTVYSGTILGWECRFTVTDDKTVTFHCGEKCYGPYTARQDPTAIPDDMDHLSGASGVEIRKGDEIFFRGAAYRSSNGLMLFEEDGGIHINIVASGGIMIDEDGNVIDRLEPSALTVLELMDDPELTSKGKWGAWFGAVLLSVFTAVSILFADELFRLSLMFRVQDVDMVEPSDWEIAGRYIAWTILAVTVFAVYMIGLQ